MYEPFYLVKTNDMIFHYQGRHLALTNITPVHLFTARGRRTPFCVAFQLTPDCAVTVHNPKH